MKLSRDIQSLSVFKRDSAKFMRQLKKTKEPIVLTVNGKASIVVQDAESYEELLHAKEKMDALHGIQKGLADLRAGRTTPSDEFFEDFFSRYNIPESE
jgi:prevent-host-death family protein